MPGVPGIDTLMVVVAAGKNTLLFVGSFGVLSTLLLRRAGGATESTRCTANVC